MTTDAEGRFILRGVGRGLRAGLVARHPQFALQMVAVETDETPGPKAMTAALAPSQIIHLRVTYADTGRPVRHSPLLVTASRAGGPRRRGGDRRRGPLPPELLGGGPDLQRQAYPPRGEPYLVGRKTLEWPKGPLTDPRSGLAARGLDLRDGRRGGQRQPVAGATVTYRSARTASEPPRRDHRGDRRPTARSERGPARAGHPVRQRPRRRLRARGGRLCG